MVHCRVPPWPGQVSDYYGSERSLVVIGTADDGVRESGGGLGYFAEDQRAGAAAKGGAERYQSEIDSVEALGRDASLEN